MKYNASMFDEIKDSYNVKTESSFKDIMKFEIGNTYLVRLVPNLEEPKKSIYHYFHHSWTSVSTGKFISVLCPTTYGESCPIDDYVMKIYRNGTKEEKEVNKAISRKDNWMVGVYVINDPVNPDNNGKHKAVRYGHELNKIIESAMTGDDKDEFGGRIFDLVDGCTLRIKCEAKSDKVSVGKKPMATYASSKFLAPSKLEEMTDEKLEAIYANLIDLTQFMKPKKSAELQRTLDEHFFGIKDTNIKEETSDDGDSQSVSDTSVDSPVNEGSDDNGTDSDTDAKLKALLDGLV